MKSDRESDEDDIEQNELQGALVIRSSKITWSDVAGLEHAKKTLKELAALKTENPLGVLLFGVRN